MTKEEALIFFKTQKQTELDMIAEGFNDMDAVEPFEVAIDCIQHRIYEEKDKANEKEFAIKKLEELNKKLLATECDIEFDKFRDVSLMLVIDPFNNHISWEVKWDQLGIDTVTWCQMFDKSEDAFKFYIDKIKGMEA